MNAHARGHLWHNDLRLVHIHRQDARWLRCIDVGGQGPYMVRVMLLQQFLQATQVHRGDLSWGVEVDYPNVVDTLSIGEKIDFGVALDPRVHMRIHASTRMHTSAHT